MALSQRAIFKLYWPLALSWLFMAVEGPVALSIVSRLPDAKVNQAAFVVLFGLAIFIESPVMDLLATSTTLASSRLRYLALRRFTLILMAAVSAVHALVALTPLYGFVVLQVLAVEPEVAEVLRPAMAIMIPWSAFIGWRRFLQGLMIRHGQTRAIGLGTVLRMLTIVGVGFGCYALFPMTGVAIAATALVSSVAVECLFVHLLARDAVRRTARHAEVGETVMGFRELAGFHFPLTASTVLIMSTNPMIVAALGRTAEPMAMHAAWAIALSFLWLFRTVTYALPEAVIALYRLDPTHRAPLAKFCARVGLATSGLLLGAALSSVDTWFFVWVVEAGRPTAELAGTILLFSAALPLLNALVSYVRAMLTTHHMTTARLVAIGVAVATLAATLVLGLALRLPAAVLPGLGLSLGHAAEFAVLAMFWRARRKGVSG